MIRFGAPTPEEKAKGVIASATIPAGTIVTREELREAHNELLSEHMTRKLGSATLTVPEAYTRTERFKEDEALGIVKKVGRPPSGKVVTTLRLSPDVVAKLKAGGDGWQARADALLRTALNL